MLAPDTALAARAARLYYLEGCTRIEIARRLDISRFKVARLLEDAVESGLVTINISAESLVDPELSAALAAELGLARALVVWTGSGDRNRYSNLGRVAAQHLAEHVTSADVLGFDSGRTVSHIADHLDSLPACDVVQLAGLAGTPSETGLEVLRKITAVNGGTAYPLYAPLLAADAAGSQVLRQQPEVQTTMRHFAEVTKAVVSVGSWTPPVSQVYDRLHPAEQQRLLKHGVVAETCALMFDQAGAAVTELDQRRIGIPLDQLLATPDVIAVAGGADKAQAIRALARSKVIKSLITDEAVARVLLATEAQQSAS